MTEVHQRPAGRKGADPSAARRALRRFIKAAYALDETWHPILEVPAYPRYLPSFDKLVGDLANWQDEAEDLPYTEPKPMEPLDLADPAALRVWLTKLRNQISDATGAGEDALRPLDRRRLGRRTARRSLREACIAVEQLLAAAERGTASPAPAS